MRPVREPILEPVAIADLRPTQITVGLREVGLKRESWRGKSDKKAGAFLGKHLIPVVLGPKSDPYVIDHHHLARALHDIFRIAGGAVVSGKQVHQAFGVFDSDGEGYLARDGGEVVDHDDGIVSPVVAECQDFW